VSSPDVQPDRAGSLLFGSLVTALRSRAALAAEILALNRALWALVLHRWNGWKHSLVLVKPETVIA